MVVLWHITVISTLLGLVAAQTCANYGTSNGTACACPPGYGGKDCSVPTCGGTIFEGASRKTVAFEGFGDFGNITDCQCESGWAGEGCNVCQNANACSSAFASVSNGPATPPSVQDTGQNDTMTCNSGALVYAVSQMSCAVNNPTLQATFPGSSYLNIMRTINPSLTPIPGATGFGSANTLFASLIHSGVEQFSCLATSCSQMIPSSGASTWTCDALQCSCTHGTTFCGGSNLLSIEKTIDALNGSLAVACDTPAANGTAHCSFQQSTLSSLFGPQGLGLDGCTFGECVRRSVIDAAANTTTMSSSGGIDLSTGVIAGLAVVGALIGLLLALLVWGVIVQKNARRGGSKADLDNRPRSVGVEWKNLEYAVLMGSGSSVFSKWTQGSHREKLLLDSVHGRVEPGSIMAILGPSGAGKTTLIEVLAQKPKQGRLSGSVTYPSSSSGSSRPTIGFVPQVDVLSPFLSVRESLLFAARLRLPEHIPDSAKMARVAEVLDQLGLDQVADSRVGAGLSGGERRRLTIGLEVVARPDVLVLDEPTSGLDAVAAARVVQVLRAIAHDPDRPTAVLVSIHQPSSRLYHLFDAVTLLAHGRIVYSGPGGAGPAQYFAARGKQCPDNYNVADFLLEVASEAPSNGDETTSTHEEKEVHELSVLEKGDRTVQGPKSNEQAVKCETSFLTQYQVLAGREWKVLRRDKTLLISHIIVAAILGVFVGGLYFKTDLTIAGFQSRVGCLFFLGALIAFANLSALYTVVESRALFVRERSNGYYSAGAWLMARTLFDLVPLRIVPTLVVSCITYWMAGLSHDAAHFFKFLLILFLFTLCMTLWNYLLGAAFRNAGLAILISALSALYQMTYAGFFVHLSSIPPILRWLQWICPLKFTLEALVVNEVNGGLMIEDLLAGVPVNISAVLIMQTLFGFGEHNYYRDVLVHVAFIIGFGALLIGTVWLRVRERR